MAPAQKVTGQMRTLQPRECRGGAWVDLLAPAGPGTGIARRATEQEIARKRREVAGEDPSPLERLLAERVARC